MKADLFHYVSLILTAALFLLIGRCTSTAQVDHSRHVRAADIILADGEVIIDRSEIKDHIATFHEDPACYYASGKQLVKVPYDTFRQARLVPCAYCCHKYKYK